MLRKSLTKALEGLCHFGPRDISNTLNPKPQNPYSKTGKGQPMMAAWGAWPLSTKAFRMSSSRNPQPYSLGFKIWGLRGLILSCSASSVGSEISR